MAERGGIYSFLKLAPVYELWSWAIGNTNAFTRFVDDHLRPSMKDIVLDLGCGSGNFCTFLPAKCGYIGCDPNPHYIKAAQKKFAGRGMFWQQGFHRDSPFFIPDEIGKKYTIVLSMSVFHHLNDDEAELLIKTAFDLVVNSTEKSRFVVYDSCLTHNQSTFSRWLTLRDRGMHLRESDWYPAAIGKYFPHVSHKIITNLYRLPWHIIMVEATI